MTKALFAIATIVFFEAVARGESQEHFHTQISASAISTSNTEPPVAISDADSLIRASLGGEHQSADDIERLSKNLERSFGMGPEDVLESFISIAESPSERKETRTAAIFAFCSLSDGTENERLKRFFGDEDDWIRETSLAATMGALPTVSSQLVFLDDRLRDWQKNARFQNDVLVLIGRFHQILRYKSGTETEREKVLAYFREHARTPLSAAFAFGSDTILARFDPQWPASPERRELLRRWKDDPSLPEYARTKMNEAWTSCPPDSVFSADAVPDSETVRPKPEPSETGFGDGGLDSRGGSPQSADPGKNGASPAVWILGTAALALAAALVGLVLRRNRRR